MTRFPAVTGAAAAVAEGAAVTRAPGASGSHAAERHREGTHDGGPAADEVGVAKLARRPGPRADRNRKRPSPGQPERVPVTAAAPRLAFAPGRDLLTPDPG